MSTGTRKPWGVLSLCLLLTPLAGAGCGEISSPTPSQVDSGRSLLLVEPRNATLQVGETVQLRVIAEQPRPIVGVGRGPVPGATWSSSNPEVARVSATGLVTGMSAGLVTVTAKALGESAVSVITVR